jgi:hypothetical protein
MMASLRDPDDPKGLIRESYRIEGITDGECRSILMDWALSLPLGTDQTAAARRLHARHAGTDHPMTVLLAGAAEPAAPSKRRGGRAARVASSGPDGETS